MSFLATFAMIVAVSAVVILAITAISYFREPARVLFAKTVELFRTDPDGWTFRDSSFSWEPTICYHSSGVRVYYGKEFGPTKVAVGGGEWIEAGPGWYGRIRRAARYARRLYDRTQELNAICDGVEQLGARGVIPMRRRK